MNILNKISIKNLKLNKKRTIGTLIGIILSVSLICAVSGMATSFRKTLIQHAIDNTGYYHVLIKNINNNYIKDLKNNRDIKDVYNEYDMGYSLFDSQDKDEPYIHILSNDDVDKLGNKIAEGRMPKNNNEIVITRSVSKYSKYKLGDTIELNIGKRTVTDEDGTFELDDSYPFNEDEKLIETNKKSYKIVGIVERNYNYNTSFYGITVNETSDKINSYVSLENIKDYKTSLTELLSLKSYKEVRDYEGNSKYEYQLNSELLRWEVFDVSDTTLSMLYSVVCVVTVIIMVTSIFCIRNSFAISTTEKKKMYGMVASIGATRKQIKNSVIYEAFILSLIGIPIGIMCGILAVYILVNVINIIMGEYLFDIVFSISIYPILLSIVLGFITIYLSAITSAHRASRISPIESLRGTDEIKIKNKKLKTPFWVNKIFKTGGVLAYKNLKRSKKKYRTTVISLTVSIFVFITMTSFLKEGFNTTNKYYKDYKYNLVLMNIDDKINDVNKIKKFDDIKNSYMIYRGDYYKKDYGSFILHDISKVRKTQYGTVIKCDGNNEFDEDGNYICNGTGTVDIEFISLDDDTFRAYVNDLKLDYNKVKENGILYDKLSYIANSKDVTTRTYTYEVGDKIKGTYDGNDISISIGGIADEVPYGMYTNYGPGYLIVNQKYYEHLEFVPYLLTIDANNVDDVVKNIKALNQGITIRNIEDERNSERAMIIVVSIFLYGFITVITLIGVTNIFNTITSNMELRQKEFAMLKSIGMTKKEFNRMVNLETLFYSSKSLIYGIILSIFGSFAIFKAFKSDKASTFKIEIMPIIIAIIFVLLLVYIIMRYSINKINKQNTIETIRKENI